MANNRMMLKCKDCQETIHIAKYYPISWGARIESEWLDDWFTAHDQHSAESFSGDVSMGAEFYELVYESEQHDEA